jgi:ubiquitin carboxyl-terminal hydrolase 4/11/15
MRKLDTPVDFLEKMNFKEFIAGPQNSEDQWYRLYAVSNHMGGLGGGHYTANALVQSPFDGPNDDAQWYSFNDSGVGPGKPNARSSSPYILFYEKVPNPPAPAEDSDDPLLQPD